MWTLSTDNDTINVRAVIDVKTQQHEIRDLITALEKRITEEKTDERSADV